VNNIETLGIADILIGGLLKAVRGDWAYLRIPVNRTGRGSSLEVADKRPTVVKAAEKVFAVSAEINAAKRKRSSGGKSQSDLHRDLSEAKGEFHETFKSPAIVSVQEQVVVGGELSYQRVLLNDAEGDEPEAVFTCIRVRGTWHRDPIRSPFMPIFGDRDRTTALLPVFATSDPVTIWELGEERVRGFRVSFPEGFRIATFERVVSEEPEEETIEVADTVEAPPPQSGGIDAVIKTLKETREVAKNGKIETECVGCGKTFRIGPAQIQKMEQVLCSACRR